MLKGQFLLVRKIGSLAGLSDSSLMARVRSSCQRPPSRLGDPPSAEFLRAPASDDALGRRDREAATYQRDELPDAKAVRKHDCFGHAIAGGRRTVRALGGGRAWAHVFGCAEGYATSRRHGTASQQHRRIALWDTIGTLTPLSIEIVVLFPPLVRRVMGRKAPRKRLACRVMCTPNGCRCTGTSLGAPPTPRFGLAKQRCKTRAQKCAAGTRWAV